jgi:hypothetical protein
MEHLFMYIFQQELEPHQTEEKMGVASPSTKRRIGTSPDDDDVVSAKIAKRVHFNNNNSEMLSLSLPLDGSENSSDFLTTSILARTLLTSSPMTMPDPLESLKCSLEALPAPDHLDFSITTSPSIFTVLSPIDSSNNTSSQTSKCSSLLDLGSSNTLITEDENGKSYFNLGSSDSTTIVARKSSSSSNNHHQGGGLWSNCQNNNNGGMSNGNSSQDFDDNASSSSCESISSEDLFNSGEEFDPSDDDDDEDELSSYKQQRSTVLHLSLCKLNKFRSVRKLSIS